MTRPFLDTLAQYFPSPPGIAEEPGRSSALIEFCHALQRLRAALPEIDLSPAAADWTRATVERLFPLCGSYGDDRFEAEAARLYADPSALQRDVELVLGLDRHPESAAAILHMSAYADTAQVPDQAGEPPLHELRIDRRLLLQRLLPATEIATAAQVEALSSTFDVFRRRYRESYLAHHAAYQAWLRGQAAPFDHDADSLRGLTLLNRIDALGPPLGEDLAARHDALRESLHACDRDPAQLALELDTVPLCPSCALTLADPIPEDAVTALRAEIQSALRGQRQRLARALVDRAIDDPNRPAFDRLLRALRAADLDPFIAVLDEPSLALVRELLQERPGT